MKHGSLATAGFDPAYMAAKLKAKDLGDFSYFYSMMTQPKTQLETFKSWAGKDSDISYYLNSHHIDVLVWLLNGQAYPTKVTASASAGVATEEYGCVKGTEDTITLLVEWQSSNSPTHRGTAIFTASWTAPTHSGVHSDQGFHYAASKGDIRIDQAHRGFQTIVCQVVNSLLIYTLTGNSLGQWRRTCMDQSILRTVRRRRRG